MNKKEMIIYNMLIAEFMYPQWRDYYDKKTEDVDLAEIRKDDVSMQVWLALFLWHDEKTPIEYHLEYHSLRYYDSWDWLMKVVTKIYTLIDCNDDIMGVFLIQPDYIELRYDHINKCQFEHIYQAPPSSIVDHKVFHGLVYDAVIRFIEFYNKSEKNVE